MNEGVFDLAAFYSRVGATAKEEHVLRQDLVRGLKDYHTALYGFDRYGAETVLLLPERMSQPRIYGYGVLRVLHDRRISDATKSAVARYALKMIDYGADNGLPYGLFTAVRFLAQLGTATIGEVRYALVASAGSEHVFEGVEKLAIVELFGWLASQRAMPDAERAYWGHFLITRHGEASGSSEIAHLLLGEESIAPELRRELCFAWVNARQPRLFVDIPDEDGSEESAFVLRHMPFWVSHAPSWPSPVMVHAGLLWLARMGEDPVQLAEQFIGTRDGFADSLHMAIGEILSEHRASIPEDSMKRLIEQGLHSSGSSPMRRRFYRLGSELFGPEYLRRASGDSANSVRQWAVKQLEQYVHSDSR